MLGVRHLALTAMFAIAVPASSAEAQQWGLPQPWGQSASSPAYNTGYSRGLSAGEEDGRRGQSFNYADETDYRRADAGYRSQYGNRDRYRNDFRRGFEVGYRSGFDRYNRRPGVPTNPGYPGYPGNRGGDYGYGNSWPGSRYDLARENGYTDGYNEGLKDGRDRHRFDPIAESRYRNGDHGYERWYGSKDAYKIGYRDAFRQGYERGYDEGRRAYYR
jgi:hypothetical protein